MKKLLLTLTLLLTLGFAASAGSWSFGPSSGTTTPFSGVKGDNVETSVTLNEVAWTAAFDCSKTSRTPTWTGGTPGAADNKCYTQFGTASDYIKSLTLTTDAFSDKYIKTIKVRFANASKDARLSVSVKVGDHVGTFADGEDGNATIYSSGQPYDNFSTKTLSFDNATGDITIVFTNSVQKGGMLLRSIYVEYADEAPQPAEPTITAASETGTYEAGDAEHAVEKGTKVTFTVTNCEDAAIEADNGLVFTNGKAEAIINNPITYNIKAGETTAKYVFTVIKPTLSEEKIFIKDGETELNGDVELYAGTDLTFGYADAIEGLVISYSTDLETYTPGNTYRYIPEENTDGILDVKVAYEDVEKTKGIIITKKAVAAPTFNVENGEIGEGSIINVAGQNVVWTVKKNDGEAETLNGASYLVNDAVGTVLIFTATASVTINGITTNSEAATLNVTVAEKPFEPITVEEWQLVTDASTLAAGDQLIIAYTTGNVAMSTENNTNNRKEISVTISDGVLTYDAAETHKPLILELGGESGKWTFKTLNYEGTNGYFACATGDSNNHLKISTDGMAASISIAASSDATIKFDAGTDSPRNQIKYNDASNGHVFSCYNSTQKAVQIYKLVKKEIHPEVANFAHNGVTVKGVSATLDYELHVANHAPGAKYNVTLTFTPETGDVVTASNDTHTIVVEEAPVAAPAREAAVTKLSGNVSTNKLAPKTTYAVKAAITVNGKTEESKIEDLGSITSRTTGIEDVTVEGNEAAEYFNLQGIRVAEPQAGQVYIVRRGAKTTKELVK